jgi:DNA-binding CsgD family transcriptional regulator/PAS domain-containing protein
LGAREAAQVRAIEPELEVLRFNAGSIFDVLLPDLRQLLQTDTLLIICPELRATGWGIARYHGDNFPDAPRFQRVFTRFLASAPRRFAWYNAIRPEPDQRNRVLDPFDIIPSGELEVSGIYHQVLLPMRLHRHRQLRALLCDGASLLGWFGTFHAGPIEQRHVQLLTAFAPAVQRRLTMERRLQVSPRTAMALEAALEQLGCPALVIGATGQIFDANVAAQALLADRGAEVHEGLLDALAGRASALRFALVPLAERGAPACWLATLRAGCAQARITSCVAAAGDRWGLTARQREVLEQIVSGHANSTIAAAAGTSERAVELHVTALFDRAGVNSRSALVASVLLG